MDIIKNTKRFFSQAFPGAGSTSVLGYKVYNALLNQTGTNAPVATVLQNTLSGTPVWNYDVIGGYYCLLSSEFPLGKTFVIAPNITNNSTYQIKAYVSSVDDIWVETNEISVVAGVYTITGVNDALVNYPIEIRVYP